jgi:hypothetical protein
MVFWTRVGANGRTPDTASTLLMYMMQPSLIYWPAIRRGSISASFSFALPSVEALAKYVQIEATLIDVPTHCFLQSRYALGKSKKSAMT